MTDKNEPLAHLADVAALWATGKARAHLVVDAAVQALVSGIDSPTLGQLAGVTRRSADDEVPDLWPLVADELGLPNPEPQSEAALLMAAKASVRRMRASGLSARAIAAEFHSSFGHGQHALIEALVSLDDEYDLLQTGAPARGLSPRMRRGREASTRALDAAVLEASDRLLTFPIS